MSVKCINVAFAGTSQEKLHSVARNICKKGTESDISIYDRKEADIALSISVPRTYPERIQPLLQCISMSDYVVLFLDTLDATAGEEIIAATCFERQGVVVSDQETGSKALRMISAISRGWRLIESGHETERALREHLLSLDFSRHSDGDFWRVDVDHSFEVRGVGTVCLGTVRYGTVHVHDNALIMPSGKEGMVRSIQIFDEDFREAPAGSRVGLAIKGATPEDMQRGAIVTNNMHYETSEIMRMHFARQPYFREDIVPGKIMHLCLGLQCRQCRILSADSMLDMEMEGKLAFESENAVLFSARPPGALRIAGHGRVEAMLR